MKINVVKILFKLSMSLISTLLMSNFMYANINGMVQPFDEEAKKCCYSHWESGMRESKNIRNDLIASVDNTPLVAFIYLKSRNIKNRHILRGSVNGVCSVLCAFSGSFLLYFDIKNDDFPILASSNLAIAGFNAPVAIQEYRTSRWISETVNIAKTIIIERLGQKGFNKIDRLNYNKNGLEKLIVLFDEQEEDQYDTTGLKERVEQF